MSPALPITPEEIVSSGCEAYAAGAAVLHLHARDPRTGQPTPDPDVFMQFLPALRDRTDAVINLTTGGSVQMTLEERLAAPMRAKPELCSLNLGSMNFVFSQMAAYAREWKHEWERPYLLASEDTIFKNTFRDIERILRQLGEAHGTRFEFECYDVGHLYTLAHFAETGLAKPPFFVQMIFGIKGGIGAHASHLTHMMDTAQRLLGDDHVASVFAAGRHQMPFVTTCAANGGHVRVGLEDSLYIGYHELASSNAQQVTKIREIVEGLGKEVAKPEEARELLGLKGSDAVGF
jgi:uncharacterized protein (DUF849 family)